MKPDNLIVYEDNSILIIDKPQGLATGLGNKNNLCTLFFNNFPDLKNVKGYKKGEGGLLNRLDNETGGITLFAKNDEAFQYYHKEMKNNNIEKKYITVVDGIPEKKEGIIKYSIAHHYKDIKKMVVVHDQLNIQYRGKPREAITEWKVKVVDTINNKSILVIKITKGVRHQIRVHLAYIGLPIIGDKIYNKKQNEHIYENHLLYANGILFVPYGKKKELEINIKVPFLDEINQIV